MLHCPIAKRRYCRYTCLPSDSFSLTLLSFTTRSMLAQLFPQPPAALLVSVCDELSHVSALLLKLRSSPALADTYIAKQKARTIAIQVIIILCFSISISIPTRKLLHQYTGTVEGLCQVLLKATSQTIFIFPNFPGFYNLKLP